MTPNLPRDAAFTGFAGTMQLSDFPRPFIIGYGSASPMRPAATIGRGRSRGISRFSRMENIVHAQGLGPRGTDQGLAITRLIMLPSGPTTPSASRRNDFAAQYLAYTNPCQRFANALTDVHA